MARRAVVPAPALDSLVARAITRGLSERYAAAEEDVARIIEATYRVIERTGTVDPRVRDILDEAGLSSPVFYRHFASKDELLLVILDDGRRRLADYLTHRMQKATSEWGQVRAWIEGVAAQAIDHEAASRTRPFIANGNRLAERFPAEQLSSQQALLSLLEHALGSARTAGTATSSDLARDARAIFDLSFAFMERHVLATTSPTTADVKHLVAFCARAAGAETQLHRGAPPR
jgi:AcrR family transcriptional regulator